MERMMKVQEVILKNHGREPQVVGSRRNHWGIGPDHEAVAERFEEGGREKYFSLTRMPPGYHAVSPAPGE